MTAVLILMIGISQPVTVSTVYFQSFAACEAVIEDVMKQANDLQINGLKVQAKCYEEARNE